MPFEFLDCPVLKCGLIDRILMGVGTARGRKSTQRLEINDVIDFFRIENIKDDELLLLRAEMKLPGRAWLEFRIDHSENEKHQLTVNAYFQTRTFFGRIYWYMFLPFHKIIFKDLIEEIDNRSSLLAGPI